MTTSRPKLSYLVTKQSSVYATRALTMNDALRAHALTKKNATLEDSMSEEQLDNKAAMTLLNEILETELAGVVRYTHYSLMVFGHSRIPIVDWLRGEANACLSHAIQAGELVTHFGEHPSLKICALLETHKHGINDILLEALEAEKAGLALYKKLLVLVRDRSV